MASLVSENRVCIKGSDDKSNGVEITKFDTALLMSLLEESNGEEYHDDEKLNRVMRSLEAEMNGGMLKEGHGLAMDSPELVLSEEEDGQNCLASMEFRWSDNMELVPSSPSDDMNWSNYYMDICEQDLDSLVEIERVCDYSEIYNGVVSWEERGFSTMWHETQ